MREEDEPYHHAWVLPQGYPRHGEPLTDAAAREVWEELGLDVEVGDLVGVYEDFSDADGVRVHWVTVCYQGRPRGGALPRPSHEAIDFAWIDPATPGPAGPPAVRRILADLAHGRRRARP
jgi:8-oxo-dGTP diphosphatase